VLTRENTGVFAGPCELSDRAVIRGFELPLKSQNHTQKNSTMFLSVAAHGTQFNESAIPPLLTIHNAKVLCLGILTASSEVIEIGSRQVSVHPVKLWSTLISEAMGWTLIAASPRFPVFLNDIVQSASCENKHLLVIRTNVYPRFRNSTRLSNGFR
jgi:hypothetical protein